ncbi:unnamed protein product, partial [Iphiclides podalirius]
MTALRSRVTFPHCCRLVHVRCHHPVAFVFAFAVSVSINEGARVLNMFDNVAILLTTRGALGVGLSPSISDATRIVSIATISGLACAPRKGATCREYNA